MKDFYETLIEYIEYKGYTPVKSEEGKIIVESEMEEKDALRDDLEIDELRFEEDEEKLTMVVVSPVVHEDDLLRLEEADGHRILVSPEEVPPETRDSIPDDVEIWDRGELIPRFGEMVVEKSLLKGEDEGIEGIKGPKEEVDFDIEHEGGERILSPIIDFEDVSEVGEKIANGFKYTLELVPHYLYTYEVKKGEGSESGKLYLNAISGKPNFWERPFESIDKIKRSHVKMEPNISEGESTEKALDAVKDNYSEKKVKKWEEDGTTIVEKEREEPQEEDIELEKKGMIYVPMWAIEGTEKILVINAARGKIERAIT